MRKPFFLRLCLLWLLITSGNTVFGWVRKIGSNGKSFPLTIKYALWPYKTISVCILPSNEFRPRKIEERERNSKPDPTPVRSHPSIGEIAPIGATTQAKPDHLPHKLDRLHPSPLHPKPISSSTHPRLSLFSTHRWSLDRHPQPTALPSCMQPRFGSDRLLMISSPLLPPLDRPTHDQSPLSLSQSASLFSSITHSFFLLLSVWPRIWWMVFCFEFCFFKFIYWNFLL